MALAFALGLAPAARASSTEGRAKAKVHFQAGATYYREARYADAIREFQDAYAYDPNPQLLFNIAQAYEKLGSIPDALHAYRDYLRQSPQTSDRTTVELAVKNLEAALAKKGLSQVAVYTTPAGAVVQVDGRVVGMSPTADELAPGRHTLEVRLEGHKTVERDFGLVPGRSLDIEVTLDKGEGVVMLPPIGEIPLLLPAGPPKTDAKAASPLEKTGDARPPPPLDESFALPTLKTKTPEPEPPRPSKLSRVGWPAWACLGGAALGVGVGAALQASKASYETQADGATVQLAYQSLYNDASARVFQSRVAFGAAAALGVAAAVLAGVELGREP